MPIYVYRCPECEIEEEHSHAMDADPIVVCIDDGQQMVRAIQSFTLHMKTPTNMVRFKREEAQRIRGNRELLEGIPGAQEHASWRKRRDARNKVIRERVAARQHIAVKQTARQHKRKIAIKRARLNQ